MHIFELFIIKIQEVEEKVPGCYIYHDLFRLRQVFEIKNIWSISYLRHT